MGILPFLLIYTVPAAAALGIALGGFWTFAVPVYVFVLVPIVDALAGDNRCNPRDTLAQTPLDRLARHPAYLAVLVLYVPVQYAVTVWALAEAGGSTGLDAYEWIGLAVSVGVMNGAIGITIAHEFIHRTSAAERGLGVALLATVLYPHFRIEHVQGHHANVGTPLDPASARRGQSVYSFWRQSVFGSLRSAWMIERRRMRRLGLPVVSVRNRMLQYVLIEAAFFGLVGWFLGPLGVLFFVVQAVVGFSLLEIVNYVEHYGLARAYDGSRYERVRIAHSWDSPRRLTNYLLVNLQRHADHHVGPHHRYQVLSHTDRAPQLPAGYAGMVLLALVPPAWFRTIDPLLDAYDASRSG